MTRYKRWLKHILKAIVYKLHTAHKSDVLLNCSGIFGKLANLKHFYLKYKLPYTWCNIICIVNFLVLNWRDHYHTRVFTTLFLNCRYQKHIAIEFFAIEKTCNQGQRLLKVSPRNFKMQNISSHFFKFLYKIFIHNPSKLKYFPKVLNNLYFNA